MPGIRALVTEGAIEFEDLFQPAHNETLEIKFRGNAQIQVYIQRVVVRDERLCGRAPGKGMHHGSFHFHEAVLFHEAAKFPDNARTLAENIARAGIDYQIDVSLPIAQFHIGQTGIFVRQRPEGLRQELHCGAFQRKFARLCAEQLPRHAHDVPDIQLFEHLEGVIPKPFPFGVALNSARAILKMEENHLSKGAGRDHASGKREGLVKIFKFFAAVGLIFGAHAAGVVFLAEVVGKERNTRIQQVTGFHHAVFDHFIQIAVFGETFQHGHEIGRVFRMRGKLDGLLCFVLRAQGNSPGLPARGGDDSVME